jgi:hypothetical protein
MKCIHCGKDSNLKDREPSRACPACGRRFAFEPTTDSHKITDGFFKKTTEAVSGTGQLSFTERQLWYEFNRRLARRLRWWTGALTAAGIAFFITVIVLRMYEPLWVYMPPVIAGTVVGLLIYLNQVANLRFPRVPFANFRSAYLQPWISAHGDIARLVPTQSPRFGKPAGPEPDLSSYSFDRALVVDSTPLAAMLVANNFHFENNCAILSADGFPHGRAASILEMLRCNPSLTVYALHDASPNGCRLPLVLRQPDWFPDRSIFVFDLGLLPRHVAGKPWMIQRVTPQTLSPEQLQRFTPAEVKWLMDGKVAELEYLRPTALIRSVYRGIGRSAEATARRKNGEKDDKQDDGDGGGGYSGGDVIIHHDYEARTDGEGHPPDSDGPDAGDFTGDDFGDGADTGGDAGADAFG